MLEESLPAEQRLRQPVTISTPARRGGAGGAASQRTVRLGFLGLGWIGLNRMQSILDHPNAQIAAVADPSQSARDAAAEVAPRAAVATDFDSLLQHDLDGVVIATPSGQHADQVHAALQHGLAVFCQKPLARTTCQTYRVVNEARAADRLLGVDFCYRHLSGAQQLRDLVQSGALGRLFSIDLVFHNAYGPDKSWAHDVRQSGGGCVIDLATHLVDLALWMCGDPPAREISSRLYRSGQPVERSSDEVEDAGYADWCFGEDVSARLACSWNFSAGRDAEIKAAFHGTEGAAVLRNVDGSFYDFAAEHYRGANVQQIAGPPDSWGGRALAHWTSQLAAGTGFDPDIERCLRVAELIDSIYGR